VAETAFMTRYVAETVQGFEQRQALLRDTVTTDVEIDGNTAVFLVADSGSARAVTRGTNGLITGRADSLAQNTTQLVELHDKPIKTGFNIFSSQGDQRRIMQEGSRGVINREMDLQIITELQSSTVNTGAAVTGSVALFVKAMTMLGNAKVPYDGNVTLLCTPAFLGYLQLAPEFGSADYVGSKPAEGANDPSWKDKPQMYRWKNTLIIPHPALPGIGTAAAECYLYHKSAVGHAMNSGGIKVNAGYNEEHDYSFAHTILYCGAKLLQNAGVITINHNDLDLSA
jgi:hypothetical protein